MELLQIRQVHNGKLLGSAVAMLFMGQMAFLAPKSAEEWFIVTVSHCLQVHLSTGSFVHANGATIPNPNPNFDLNHNPNPNPDTNLTLTLTITLTITFGMACNCRQVNLETTEPVNT